MVDTTPVIAAKAISRKTSQQRATPVYVSVPLEIRLKVLRRVTEMSTVQDLEIILIKLWRIVKQLGDSEQIGYLKEAQSAAGSTRPEFMSLEEQDSHNIKLEEGSYDEVSRSTELQR